MAEVRVENLSKRYGAVEVMQDVNVTIPDGAFVVLVGPSGCGKSTLLRMIAGLESISGGTVRIGGRVVNDLRPRARDIAMVFQSYALYPHMSVAENMSFSLRLKHLARDAVAARVEPAARMLGLTPLMDRLPRALSGGQRQRVAMGRALVRQPQVFLFDEPLSNLDAALRVQMRSEIKELHQRVGTTTIYVTHDQIEAMTMADTIVVLRDGRIEQVGGPLELFDRPANVFVAGFIGSPAMNLLRGRMTPQGFLPDGGLPLPAPFVPGAATYGIRPEHLRLDPAGVEATVAVVEPLGSETQIVARLGEASLTCLVRDRIALRPGDPIRLRPEVGQVHLFDADGRRCEAINTAPTPSAPGAPPRLDA